MRALLFCTVLATLALSGCSDGAAEERIKELQAENERLRDELAKVRKEAEDEATARARVAENLKQLTLKLQQIGDLRFNPDWPKAADRKDGWFWHLLPYLEQDDLYKKLGERKSDNAPKK